MKIKYNEEEFSDRRNKRGNALQNFGMEEL